MWGGTKTQEGPRWWWWCGYGVKTTPPGRVARVIVGGEETRMMRGVVGGGAKESNGETVTSFAKVLEKFSRRRGGGARARSRREQGGVWRRRRRAGPGGRPGGTEAEKRGGANGENATGAHFYGCGLCVHAELFALLFHRRASPPHVPSPVAAPTVRFVFFSDRPLHPPPSLMADPLHTPGRS